MIKLATPISHLFENGDLKKRIIEHSDCLECRDRTFNSDAENQELFHCELQPIHDWTNEEFEYLEKIKKTKESKSLLLFIWHLVATIPKL